MGSKKRTLIIGSSGQIGTELVAKLRELMGMENVIAADIKRPAGFSQDPFVILDAMDKKSIFETIKKYDISEVYLLAALLSATSEKNPEFAWKLNMEGLLNILDLAREKHVSKVFWPSSIAVFGPSTPKKNTPQFTITEPNTVYGISKLAGERWCEYYHQKYNVDVRSIRYPGLIGYRSKPGGGTTDYAVHIFYHAKREGKYECFLNENTMLPMMFMDDAIDATIKLMNVEPEKVKIHSSYNVGALSFTPKMLGNEIQKIIPEFTMNFKPDNRQAIADSWPESINDEHARNDWNWSHRFNIQQVTEEMLRNITENATI